jgi:dihydroxyacetone kinase-like protein
MDKINVESTVEMIIAACDEIVRKKEFLTKVDSEIGDGDHGIGMSGGMQKAKKALIQNGPYADINTVFKVTGMAMLNSMGGASGVIFGSMFLGGIKNMETITELDGNSFTVMMRSALDSIKERGKAQVGDKTMVDALEPAVIAMEKLKSNDLSKTLEAAADAATQGMEDSKKHVAKYGRAQYLGDRAIGYQDAGATSVSIIFNAMNDYCKNA